MSRTLSPSTNRRYGVRMVAAECEVGRSTVYAALRRECLLEVARKRGPKTDHSDEEKWLAFSNWTEYIDVSDDNKRRPSLEEFRRRTGIKVRYTRTSTTTSSSSARSSPSWRPVRTPAVT